VVWVFVLRIQTEVMFLGMYIARNQRCERDRLREVSTILVEGML
jgi:hypothetical protein